MDVGDSKSAAPNFTYFHMCHMNVVSLQYVFTYILSNLHSMKKVIKKSYKNMVSVLVEFTWFFSCVCKHMTQQM